MKSELGVAGVQVKKDGNCFYSCFGLAVGESHQTIREKYGKSFAETSTLFDFETKEVKESYLQKINTQGVWGGEIEASIMGQLFDLNVLIVDASSKKGT